MWAGFETRSTHKGDIHVEICSACHPFFTGKQKLVDTAGRVERFRRKYAKSERVSRRGPRLPPQKKHAVFPRPEASVTEAFVVSPRLAIRNANRFRTRPPHEESLHEEELGQSA